MRIANIIAGVSLALWLGLFYMGRSLTYGVYTYGKGIYPNSGQIDYYMAFPICVAAVIAISAWAFNGARLPHPLIAVSVISLVVLLPFLFGYTGGM